MRLCFDQHLIASLGVAHHRDQVGHRAARDKQPALLPQHLRRKGLKLTDRRIFAEDIVPYLGAGHRLAHLIGRLSDSVTAQVNYRHATPQLRN